MVLPIKKPPVPGVKAVLKGVAMAAHRASIPAKPKPAPVVAPEPEAEKAKPKSITVRMPENHTNMLDEVITRLECDKSEGIKRGVRLMHSVFTAKEAKLIITADDGTVSTQVLVKNGVAT